ncbi:MAG: hypothetical protein HFF38_03165 [Lawsonibacter sp.]|nr:hypothetical protein [Lawsonibacter sp.]
MAGGPETKAEGLTYLIDHVDGNPFPQYPVFRWSGRPALGAVLYVLTWLPALWNGYPEDPKSLMIAGHAVNWTIFGMLSVIPIYLPTHTGIKIPRWFFYAFYPAHLAVIGVIRIVLHI